MTDQDPPEHEREENRQVLIWQRLYDWMYEELGSGDGPSRESDDAYVGWRSSYTKEPYSVAEMADWLNATQRRIRALRPRRVLEIGVGSGLLLTTLAGETDEYVGTDFSRPALSRLASLAAADPRLEARVRLEDRLADDFTGLPHHHFDVVILNSIVQYFPSEAYTRRVLEGALGVLRPGGTVFVGDVRDLRLHRAFRTGVQIQEIEAAEDAAVARNLVDDAVDAEQELLLHPGFFTTIPGVFAVDIRLKRASFRNEMSAHRYDVVLFTAQAQCIPAAATTVLDWNRIDGLETVGKALANGTPLKVTGIPNTRVWHEVEGQRLLDMLAPTAHVVDVLRQQGDGPAPDPERFCELGDKLGFETIVVWTRGEAPDPLDVFFLTPQAEHHAVAVPAGPWPPTLANDPLAQRRTSLAKRERIM